MLCLKTNIKKFSTLETTKEICDYMKINYEGNEDVQLRKVVTLTCHYEFFTIKDGEIMDDMFQNLLNRLKVLDKNFSKA